MSDLINRSSKQIIGSLLANLVGDKATKSFTRRQHDTSIHRSCERIIVSAAWFNAGSVHVAVLVLLTVLLCHSCVCFPASLVGF